MDAAHQWLDARLPIGRALASGLILNDLRLMNGKNGHWIMMPAVRLLDRDGNPRADAAGKPIFNQIIEFRDRATDDRFNEMVTALVRAADPTFPNGGRKVMAEAPLMERLDFYAAMVRSKIFTRSALAVAFFLLYRHFNGDSGRCDPSIAALAHETGLTMRSVKSAIDELRESDWWRVSREGAKALGGRTNAYAPLFEVGKRASPLSRESGEAQRHKVVKRASPGTSKEPVKRLARSISSSTRVSRNGSENGQFEAFWRAYPPRGLHANPKAPAWKKFVAAIRSGADPADIIRAAGAYGAAIRATGTDPRFVAQAVTWLNQERWTDQHQEPLEPPWPVAGMI